MEAVLQAYPQEKNALSSSSIDKTFFQVLAASGLIALCSQIKIDLPFTPVPLTLQTLAVLLIGVKLGSRKGALAVLFYFVQILAGLPVLSGGVSDPLVFLGPKGGYVLGFCLQAYLMGWMNENMLWSRSLSLFIGGIVACGVQMGLGVCMLAQFVGWKAVWTMGLFPFVPGEILKLLGVCWGLNAFKLKFSLPIS